MEMSLPNVLTLSDAAVARVRALLLADGARGVGLRVSVKNSGCAGMAYTMELAAASPGDEIVERDGARVIVDAKALLYLLGSRLDVKTENFSSTFVFENPNQTSSCGCGASVALTAADPKCAKSAAPQPA